MTRKTTRRDFVKQSAAVGAAWWIAGTTGVKAQKERSPLERISFACIGVGGKGSSDTRDAGRHGEIVALCDIDDNRLNQMGKQFPRAAKFHDYREMLDELDDKIDAVTVSTPDHHHAPAAVRAMNLGMHCFCQKPLTWSVHESRLLRQIARKRGLCTQMGNQGTARPQLRQAVEIVKQGGIGEVKEVHIWTNRPIWPQGTGRPEGSDPVPSHVKWDLFLGPAPVRPYVNNVYHPFKWRGWIDFGTGALGDMACHTANMAVMALDLFDPASIEVVETSGIVENETYPKFTVLKFEFPRRGKLPACTTYWYDGGKLPDAKLIGGERPANSGSIMVGSKGTMFSPGDYGDDYKLLPEDKFADYEKPEPSLPRSPGHFTEFAQACKQGKPELAVSNFDYATRLTETILLGNVALRADKKVRYDGENGEIVGEAELNKLLTRDYRDGWGLS